MTITKRQVLIAFFYCALAALVITPIAYFSLSATLSADTPTIMVLMLLLGIVGSGAVLIFGFTKAPPKRGRPTEPVLDLLNDPYVRRTIRKHPVRTAGIRVAYAHG